MAREEVDERATRLRFDALEIDLRIHTKTHKTPEIARMQVKAGAIGICAQKLGEAEVMAEKGIDISDQASTHFNEILDLKAYEAIITLCEEAEKAFPPSPSKMVRIGWEVEYASELEGSLENVRASHEKIFQYLDTHIRDLVHAILGNQIQEEEGTNVQ